MHVFYNLNLGIFLYRKLATTIELLKETGATADYRFDLSFLRIPEMTYLAIINSLYDKEHTLRYYLRI